jgi:two-component system OmpR family sensor kinase
MDGGPAVMIKSLRGRLFVGLTAVIVLTGAIGGTLAYMWAYNEAIEMQDSVLTQIGTFAINASTRQSQPVNGVDAESEVVVLELGPTPRGSADDRRLWTLHDGLHNDVRQGRPIRVLLRTRPDGSRFDVAQGDEIRSEIAGDMAVRTLLPIAALVPCLMLVTALVIGRSFRPMFRLAEELDARRAEDMSVLSVAGAPSELQSFLGSINGLLERIRAMMDQQQRFVADAAHELRMPITALSLQTENLDPLDMPTAARDRLEVLKSGMRRTRHLLDQLLTLVRQDLASMEVKETVHLDQIAKGVVADLLAEATARDVDLGFTMAEPVSVSADPVAIVSVVRNLVENAVRYTPVRRFDRVRKSDLCRPVRSSRRCTVAGVGLKKSCSRERDNGDQTAAVAAVSMRERNPFAFGGRLGDRETESRSFYFRSGGPEEAVVDERHRIVCDPGTFIDDFDRANVVGRHHPQLDQDVGLQIDDRVVQQDRENLTDRFGIQRFQMDAHGIAPIGNI